MRKPRWHRHPGVRTGVQLTRGERSADRMRNGMGSWAFVFAALAFLAFWMAANKTLLHFDPYPFILLNLVLSCVAALQGAILLIASKRSDQVSSELAEHDYQEDKQSRAMLDTLTTEFAELRRQHAEQTAQLSRILAVQDNPMHALLPISGDNTAALAILLERLGGTATLTEREIGGLDHMGAVVATQNRIEGSVTLEYRRH